MMQQRRLHSAGGAPERAKFALHCHGVGCCWLHFVQEMSNIKCCIHDLLPKFVVILSSSTGWRTGTQHWLGEYYHVVQTDYVDKDSCSRDCQTVHI